MGFGMQVSLANSIKHYKFLKDWFGYHEVMTMISFQKIVLPNSRHLSSIMQERLVFSNLLEGLILHYSNKTQEPKCEF